MDLGLGFNMIISKKQKLSLLGIIVAFILLGASCLKRQDLQVEDLGSTIDSEQMAIVLGDAFGDVDYNAIRVNEHTDIILSQRLQDGAPQNIEQQEILVKELENAATFLRIKSLVATTEFSSSGNSTDVREWNQTFPKYNGFAFASNQAQQSTTTATQLTAPLYTFQLIQNLALGACYDGGSYPETCHNLQINEIKHRVPPSSAYQHNCPDVYNCTIAAKRIEFDLLQKYNLDENGKPNRVHYSLVISKEVPFTARVLEYCTRAVYNLQGVPQKVLADLCYKVNKYTFGQP
jgi:hypothetical protein